MKKANQIPVCWACGAYSHDPHFCSTCGKIQPLGSEGKDYFRFLGCPHALRLPRDLLRRRFYELSRKFHPDYFQNRSRKERGYSLERSAALNRAYQTLRDPLKRAQYALDLEGYRPNDTDQDRAGPPSDLLMEVLELQESMEEMKRFQDPELRAEAEENAQRIRTELQERQTYILREIEVLFDAWDAKPNERPTTAARIRSLIDTRNYLVRALKTSEQMVEQE